MYTSNPPYVFMARYESIRGTTLVKSSRLRWTEYATRVGEGRNALNAGTSGKHPLETSKRRWKENMKMSLRGRYVMRNGGGCD
jgi:hypothetical protein